MDSNKIKNLAFGARDALRAEVAARIDSVLEPGSPERLDLPEKVRRLDAAIDDKGMDDVVESTAYTWFNRLCALRFMDAKGYTPVPVVTPRLGATQPAILADAAQGVFDPDFGFSRLVRDRVQSVLAGGSGSGANRTEAAYGELLVAVCDHYAAAMPYLFGEAAASSLVMPQGLLAEGSILRRIVEDMDDDECETVEVLGWLYQFYVAERKAEFNGSGRKATADDIAPATQLFTPDWIVKYLVENSLGRLWMLNNPGSALADKMDYYIAPEGETEDFIKVYSPEELTLCDPACGSGHILVYAFDLLFEIYQEEGYFPEDIPVLVLQNNLFGMEIDGRAAEIAKFALEMKAREKDPSFFDKHIDANVTLLEPVVFEPGALAGAGPIAGATELLDAFEHMTEVGSLYVPAPGDMAAVGNAIASFSEDDLLGAGMLRKLRAMKGVLEALSRRVDCVVANPPYMGSSSFNAWVGNCFKKLYPNEKGDLCTCFIKRGLSLAKPNGYSAMITMQSWMFEASYEKMRKLTLSKLYFCSLLQLGIKAFKDIGNDVVKTCAFVLCNAASSENSFIAVKLDEIKSYEQKKEGFFNEALRHCVDIREIRLIPGMPFSSYWAPKQLLDAWNDCAYVEEFGTYTGSQNVTGNNEIYVRLHWEVSRSSIGESCWVPYAKGGNFRRYYGNILHVVDWRSPAREFYSTNPSSNLLDSSLWFKEGITYSAVTSRGTGFRYLPKGCVFDKGGASIITNGNLFNLLAILNSRIARLLFEVLNPSVNLQVRDIKALPIRIPDNDQISEACQRLTRISQDDWDDSEISMGFQSFPLTQFVTSSLQKAVADYEALVARRMDDASSLMAEIDDICCTLYRVDPSLLPPLERRDYPVKDFDLKATIKSLISYGVGCIMGRYSTFAPGVILADGRQTVSDFRAKVPDAGFLPDEDAIIPVLDGEWFGDDIVAQFRKWLEVAYGAETLDENVKFIEDTLGKDLRKYFVKDFYKDHCATYQVALSGKRPIYWMFASPKGSFQVLVYMHRYTPSTVGQILTKYLREYVEKLNAKIGQLEQSDRAADNRQADKYRTVVRELTDWERSVIYPLANERVNIDLDDGVKKNYNKFPHALAKVAGLSEWK